MISLFRKLQEQASAEGLRATKAPCGRQENIHIFVLADYDENCIRKAGDNSRHERNRFKTEICRCDRYVYFSRTHRTDKHITVKKDADRKKRVQQKCAKPCLECCSCKFVAVVLENTIQHRVQRNYQKCLKSFVYQVEPFHVSDDIKRTALHSFGYQ